MSTSSVLRIAFFFLACSSAALAQIGNAALVGRVTDPGGAVIINADVQAKRVATNEVFRASTTDTGDFTIPNLPVDTYELRVANPGFKTEVRSGVRLEIGRTSRMDFQLNVGSVTDSVEVVATAPILKTETPEFGQVIDNTKIVGLPLNSRDILGTLGSLTAGVAPSRSGRLGSGLNFNVRGQRAIDNVAILDGAMISQGNAFVTFNINPDAVQEFEVKTGLYGAEYGVRPGGQFSIITKSGTNTPHGTLFEYLRNDNLDARNFFDLARRPEYKRNQFGATVGAPIYVPKLLNGRDRAWFFFGYSGQREKRFRSLTGVVPTADQKAGRFSRATDPLNNGLAFPDNTIPASRMNPVTQKFLTYWPDANTAGQAFNFTSPNSNDDSKIDQVIAKIDLRISDVNRWSGRLVFDNSPISRPNALQAFRRVDVLRTWTQSLTNTRTIKQRVINEFTVNFYRRPYYPGLQTSGAGVGRTLGITGLPASSADEDGVPVTAITGFLGLEDASRVGPSITGHWEARDSVSFDKGAHNIKLGYHWRRHIEFHGYIRRSRFTFQPRYSGQAFGDFLLGYLQSSQQGSDELRDREFQNGHYLFFQDNWKATSRLTLSIGLRYEYRSPWKDQRGYHSNFDLNTLSFDPPLQNLTLQPWETGRFEANRPLISFTKNGILPRVGVAYRLTPKTVLRTGYGIYGNEPPLGMISALGSNPRPNAELRNFISDARVPNLIASNPFNPSGQSAAAGVGDRNGFERPLPQNMVHSWGLAIQRQLSTNTAFEIGYQGSHGVHDYTVTEVNDARPGPGARQSRRPYSAFQTIRYVNGSGDTSYNGMEMKLERRPGPSGLSMLLAYTWSKSIDTVGARLNGGGDPTGISSNLTLKNNRGQGESNPMRLALNLGYELPFGAGKPYFRQGPLKYIAGGWSTHNIFTFEKGAYITAIVNTDRMDIGSTASSRPDILSSPNIDPAQRTAQRWFDTTAFALPPLSEFRYGTAGRSVIEGPGLANWDFSLLRDFRTSERTKLEFRFEAFNLTNHPNFGLPGTAIATPTFGAVTSALESRDLQFGLKFYF